MSPEFKKLAERRAEEYIARPGGKWEDYESAYLYGAQDPVLEEARRAIYRAEAFNSAIDLCRKKYLALRGDKTSEFGDGCAGAYCEIISDLQLMAKAERVKLKKILEGNKA